MENPRSFTPALARELRRPIAPDEVRFKIQRAYGDNGAPPAQPVAHLDARSVLARLNLLAPGRWRAEHEALPPEMRAPSGPGLAYRCRLVVCGAAFEDAGEGADPKAAHSDSLKRAAVRAGIGESLYAFRLPVMFAGGAPHELRTNSRGRAFLDERSLGALRARYEAWVAGPGAARFGPVLVHGPEGVVIELPAARDEDWAGRLARAAGTLPGGLRSEAVAGLAALLAGAEGQPLTPARAAELLRVLERAHAAGWSGAHLSEVSARARRAERPAPERRAAFLAHLEASVAAAA